MKSLPLVREVFAYLDAILLWGLLATTAMTILLEVSRFRGWSRLSMPFLFGTVLTSNRSVAEVVGFFLYLVGGWLFAFGYALVFASLGAATWWLGGLLGLFHGLFLIIIFLPLIPYLHPRMATEFDGPQPRTVLEPPGWLGLHYGRGTPLAIVAAQCLYGMILGTFLPMGK